MSRFPMSYHHEERDENRDAQNVDRTVHESCLLGADLQMSVVPPPEPIRCSARSLCRALEQGACQAARRVLRAGKRVLCRAFRRFLRGAPSEREHSSATAKTTTRHASCRDFVSTGRRP